jgi:DNA-binding transcriptional MerR regulator
MASTKAVFPGGTPCYSITELAREFGITARAIRFYEDQGLLNPTRQGRTRVYDRTDRTRLKLTLRGKRLGLSLAQIRELLGMYDGMRNSPKQLDQFLKILSQRRAALIQQREDIEAVLCEMDLIEHQCRALLQDKPEDANDARARLNERMDPQSAPGA